MALVIIAHVFANDGHESFVKAEMEKLIPITLGEEGCLSYELHTDNSDANHFVFVESWTSRELWQKHMGAPHLANYLAVTEGKIADFKLYELTKLAA
ncbi:hypothetical protein CTAYLR_009975 [Chrysophaeum taylorii]|uniref:ABM domain-containing protein n=1 Tax=Chrysophaeum taylorii TaxID=2483200 RepID=A0AAD7U7W1_9STRA|nr:hypothetical protein CTAYLR_009975 [Chrysophaeum taylorii]